MATSADGTDTTKILTDDEIDPASWLADGSVVYVRHCLSACQLALRARGSGTSRPLTHFKAVGDVLVASPTDYLPFMQRPSGEIVYTHGPKIYDFSPTTNRHPQGSHLSAFSKKGLRWNCKGDAAVGGDVREQHRVGEQSNSQGTARKPGSSVTTASTLRRALLAVLGVDLSNPEIWNDGFAVPRGFRRANVLEEEAAYERLAA